MTGQKFEVGGVDAEKWPQRAMGSSEEQLAEGVR